LCGELGDFFFVRHGREGRALRKVMEGKAR